METDALVRAVVDLVGIVAALSGAVALFAAKGGAAHRTGGLVFRGTVLFGGGALALLALTVGDLFHGLLLGLAAYLVVSGPRAVARHVAKTPPALPDRVGVVALAVGGVALGAWGLVNLSTAGPSGAAVLYAGSGVLVLGLAVREHRFLAREPEGHALVVQHVGSMLVAYLAVLTAWGTSSGLRTTLPTWAPWLGPIAIGAPVTIRWLAQTRAHGVRARFLRDPPADAG